MAIEAGVKLVIATDAHSVAGFSLMSFGVVTAARGWVTKSDVLNTLAVTKFKSWADSKRKS